MYVRRGVFIYKTPNKWRTPDTSALETIFQGNMLLSKEHEKGDFFPGGPHFLSIFCLLLALG
jgi:hypothetical protein